MGWPSRWRFSTPPPAGSPGLNLWLFGGKEGGPPLSPGPPTTGLEEADDDEERGATGVDEGESRDEERDRDLLLVI